MNKRLWLLAAVGVALGAALGVWQRRGSHDSLADLFPEDKLKNAVPGLQISILGNMTAKSITGGEVIMARAVAPRRIQPIEISPTALNALKGILRQHKADWICVFLAEDSALAATSNWVAMAEFHRGAITLRGGLPSYQQLDSLKSLGLPVLRPDSEQALLVKEVFDSLGIKSERWKLSQTLRGASPASLDRDAFLKLELDTRILSDIGKKHGMSGEQVRALVLGVTRYYWFRAGEGRTP